MTPNYFFQLAVCASNMARTSTPKMASSSRKKDGKYNDANAWDIETNDGDSIPAFRFFNFDLPFLLSLSS